MRNIDRQSLAFLLAGALLSELSFGKGSIAMAAWLGPVCLLRFVHLRPSVKRVLVLWPVIWVALLIANLEVTPFSGVAYIATFAFGALCAVLSYLADHIVSARVKSFAATLVFPAAWTAIEYLAGFAGGRATWGDIGYTQFGNVPLMQLASVTGIYGIGFVIMWSASAINWAWDREFGADAMRGLAVYAAIVSAVMIGGAARVALARSGASVRAAVISTPRNLFEKGEATCILENRVPASQRAASGAKLDRLQSWFLDSTRREARAGAKIVVWPEWGLLINREEEPAFLARAQRLAAEEHIYLLMGMASIGTGQKPVQNKAVLLDPSGRVAFTYLKHLLVPGMEASITSPGDGHMPIAETPLGRMTAAICYEGDFPSYIRQATQNRAGILLLPINDWRGIEDIHLWMAAFRAVENGIPVIRANSIGISAIVDPFGRVLARTDHSSPDAPVMVAQVPLQHVRTIYGTIGDLFAWLCVVGAPAGIAFAVFARRLRGRETATLHSPAEVMHSA
jgi:apolipoprotein N-acyltransferase